MPTNVATTIDTTAANSVSDHVLAYQIVARQDISYPGTSRMLYRVMFDVTSLPDSAALLATAEAIWRDGNQHWAEFTIFGYLPGLPTDEVAYVTSEFRPSGLASFHVQPIVLADTRLETASSPSPRQVLSRTPRTFRFDLTAREAGARLINIELATDLPEGTTVSIDVRRSFRESDSRDDFGGEIYSQDHSVKGGGVRVTVRVTDARWYAERMNLNARLAAAGAGVSRITRISPRIDVSALFSPYLVQPPSVLDELGSDAQYVRGEAMERVGRGYVLRATTTLAIPFQR